MRMAIPRKRFFLPTYKLIHLFFQVIVSKFEKGHLVHAFEGEIEKYFGTNCTTCSSFRMGLYFALKAFGIKNDDEVLMTPMTIPDTVNSIHVLGGRPVFVDMDLGTHNICLSDLEKKITKKSKFLLVTHLSGISPNMEEIADLANKNGLILLEDFSQNYGGQYNGKFLGTFGDVAIGSLSSAKTITSFVGGIILVRDKELMEKINQIIFKECRRPQKLTFLFQLLETIKVNLATSRFLFPFITLSILKFIHRFFPNRYDDIGERRTLTKLFSRENFFEDRFILRDKMPHEFHFWFSGFQAKMASFSFRRLESGNERRARLARKLFLNLRGKTKTFLAKGLYQEGNNTFYSVPMNCGQHRDIIQKRLLRYGIDSTDYRLSLCSNIEAFKQFKKKTPNALKIKQETLFVPLHESFTEKEVKFIAMALNNIVKDLEFGNSIK